MSGPLGTVSGNGLYGNPYAGGTSGQQRILGNPLAVTGPQFTGGSVGTADGPGGSIPGGAINSDKPGRGSNGLIPYARVVAGDFLAGTTGAGMTTAAQRLKNAQPGELVWIGRQGPNSYGGTAMAADRRMDTVATTAYVMDFYAGKRPGAEPGDAGRYTGVKGNNDTALVERRKDSRSPISQNWNYNLTSMTGIPSDESAAQRGDDGGGIYGYGMTKDAITSAYDIDDPRSWGVGVADTRAPGRSVSYNNGAKYNLLNMYGEMQRRKVIANPETEAAASAVGLNYAIDTINEVPSYSGGGLIFSLQSPFLGETALRNHECITNFDLCNFDPEVRKKIREKYGVEAPKGSSMGILSDEVLDTIERHMYPGLLANNTKDNAHWPFHHPDFSYLAALKTDRRTNQDVYLPSKLTGEGPLWFDPTRNLFPNSRLYVRNALLDPHHPLFRLDAALACFTESTALHTSVIEDYKRQFLEWAKARVHYLFRVETSVLTALSSRAADAWKGAFQLAVKAFRAKSGAGIVDYAAFYGAAQTLDEKAGGNDVAAFLHGTDPDQEMLLRTMKVGGFTNADLDDAAKAALAANQFRTLLLAVVRSSPASIGGAIRFVSKLVSECFVDDNHKMTSEAAPMPASEVEQIVWTTFGETIRRLLGPGKLPFNFASVARTRYAVPLAQDVKKPIGVEKPDGSPISNQSLTALLRAHERTLFCSPYNLQDVFDKVALDVDDLKNLASATGDTKKSQDEWDLAVAKDKFSPLPNNAVAEAMVIIFENAGGAKGDDDMDMVDANALSANPVDTRKGTAQTHENSTVAQGYRRLVAAMRYAMSVATRRIVSDRSGPHIGIWLKENPNAVTALRAANEYPITGAGARDDPVARGGVPTVSNGELATRLLMYNLSKGPEVAEELLTREEASSLLGPLSVWVPDGILLSVFGDTMVPSMSTQERSVINSRQGVVVNIGKQGVTTTHTWSGSQHLTTLPRDTVYVVLVAKRKVERAETAYFQILGSGNDNEYPVGTMVQQTYTASDSSTRLGTYVGPDGKTVLEPQFNPLDPKHVIVKRKGDIKKVSLVDFRWIKTTSKDMMARSGSAGGFMGREGDLFNLQAKKEAEDGDHSRAMPPIGRVNATLGVNDEEDYVLRAYDDGAEWILGGWRIGSVLDSAAIRTRDPLSSVASTARPTSKQQIAIDQQWLTGPQLAERFSTGSSSMCAPIDMDDFRADKDSSLANGFNTLGLLGENDKAAAALSGLNGKFIVSGGVAGAQAAWLTKAFANFANFGTHRIGLSVDAKPFNKEEVMLYLRYNGDERLSGFLTHQRTTLRSDYDNSVLMRHTERGDVMSSAQALKVDTVTVSSSAGGNLGGQAPMEISKPTPPVGASGSSGGSSGGSSKRQQQGASATVGANDGGTLADLLGGSSSSRSGGSGGPRRSRRDE